MNNIIITEAKRRRNKAARTTIKKVVGPLLSRKLILSIFESLNGTYRTLREQRVINLFSMVDKGIPDSINQITTVINNKDNELHEIVVDIILKVIDQSNEIKRNLLSKIMLFYILNKSFDDFHEMLFSNLNIFISKDFSNILLIREKIESGEIQKHKQMGCYTYNIQDSSFSLLNTIFKLINIQIFQEYNGPQGVHSGTPVTHRTGVCFFIFDNKFSTLVDYLKKLNAN